MMKTEILHLCITDFINTYGTFSLERLENKRKVKIIEDTDKRAIQAKKKCIKVDSALVFYLVKELKLSEFYRAHFFDTWVAGVCNVLRVILQPTEYNLIDYKWNEKVYEIIRERYELEHALSWLSTLGGAFSALGDYFPGCADIAGKISFQQLKLALRLGDTNVAARCRLYLSLSLIQQKRFKYARSIIFREFHFAKNAVIIDIRLLNMCRGIWSKLQYEQKIFIHKKKQYC